MKDQTQETAKKKPSVKDFGKMVVKEAVNLLVGMFFGDYKAMQVNDFFSRLNDKPEGESSLFNLRIF